MSLPKKPLPTLWVSPIASTEDSTGQWSIVSGGMFTRPYVAKTDHVPRASLDAANAEIARLRAQLTNARTVIRKFANRFHDESAEHLVLNRVAGWDVFDVPAALTPKES